MNARQYYLGVQSAIHAAPHVLRSEIRFDEVDSNECYIRGTIHLVGDLELHIAEYVVTEPAIQRLKYRYHLQRTEDRALVSRWDNVAHHPYVPTHPHHQHDDTGAVHPSSSMDMTMLLEAVLAFIPSDG